MTVLANTTCVRSSQLLPQPMTHFPAKSSFFPFPCCFTTTGRPETHVTAEENPRRSRREAAAVAPESVELALASPLLVLRRADFAAAAAARMPCGAAAGLMNGRIAPVSGRDHLPPARAADGIVFALVLRSIQDDGRRAAARNFEQRNF